MSVSPPASPPPTPHPHPTLLPRTLYLSMKSAVLPERVTCFSCLGSLPDVAQDVVGSHLLEVIFKLSSTELHQHVFESLLQGKLLYYAIHPVANYVLQSFISNLKEKDVVRKYVNNIMCFQMGLLLVCLSQPQLCQEVSIGL